MANINQVKISSQGILIATNKGCADMQYRLIRTPKHDDTGRIVGYSNSMGWHVRLFPEGCEHTAYIVSDKKQAYAIVKNW
jgi:hypothetical protein